MRKITRKKVIGALVIKTKTMVIIKLKEVNIQKEEKSKRAMIESIRKDGIIRMTL